jgi:hypothetical protein
MLIIGICGKAGSGKDTIADILVKDHGFVKVALADPLKRFCQDIFEFTTEQLWGPSEKRNEPDFRYLRHSFIDENGDQVSDFLSPRYALQKLGTEWGRDCYPDIWVEYAMRVAKRLLVKGAPIFYDARFGIRPWRVGDPEEIKGVVISDVRFLNEVEGLKKHGAKLVRVYRPVAARFTAAPEGTVTKETSREAWRLQGNEALHRSETEQDGISDELFDFILHNDGSLEDLVIVTHGFLSQFQAAQRDVGSAEMPAGIPTPPRESTKPVTYNMVKAQVDSIAAVVQDEVDVMANMPEVVGVPLTPVLAEQEGVQALPKENASQAPRSGLLEERQREVDDQKGVPPFKRIKP